MHAEQIGAIAGLDEAALDRKGVVSEWSVKNVLAHIAPGRNGWFRHCLCG
jgi:hypothetical protein